MADSGIRQDLNSIREQARQLWQLSYAADAGGGRDPTTSYRSHYSRRAADTGGLRGGFEQRPPPASPNRRNNPHPSQLFMTCRLHHVDDYNYIECTTDKLVPAIDREYIGPVSNQSRQSEFRDHKNEDHHLMLRRGTGRFSGASSRRVFNPPSATSEQKQHCDVHPEGLVFQPTRTRGDFLIHPGWPPTLPHHRVP